MSRTRLSKISMTPQGTWDSTTEYKRLDVVSNAGASWLAKQDNVGVTPVEGEDWMNLVDLDVPCKLVETITLTEDTQVFTRTAKPDGTAYKFRRLFVSIYGHSPSASNAVVYYYSTNSTLYGSAYIPRSESNGYSYCDIQAIGGMVRAYTNTGVGSSGGVSALYAPRFVSAYNSSNGFITNFEIRCTALIAAGSTINIYGIDA